MKNIENAYFCSVKSANPRPIELLAPARDAEVAVEAIKHGADAVYMGASSHGARSAASNSVEDVAAVVDYAHLFGVKVYVTLNTLVYDSELAKVERLVRDLYRIGVDALIVQDMGLLRLDIPPIALHASTQCDIQTPEKAKFLESVGFSQIVVARELSLEQMRAISDSVAVPVEAFVHGALCVSYSGDCQAGYALTGRSANRGECPQICRHAFDLVDGEGNCLMRSRYLLSLRDLNRMANLESLLEVGISSLKIEGRLKDASYVKNVVASYRRRLDEIIDANPDKYVRASYGASVVRFSPDPYDCFNRGFTSYFTLSPKKGMAAVDTPKWIGKPVGKVLYSGREGVKARLNATLENGDGLGYFGPDGDFNGFRLNRIDGDMLIPARPVDVLAGAVLYRNHDRRYEAMMESDTAERTLGLDMLIRPTERGIALDLTDESGASASVVVDGEFVDARSPQAETRKQVLGKLGDTIFKMRMLDDRCGNLFIPKSVIATLRRAAVGALLSAKKSAYSYCYRQPERFDVPYISAATTYHDNVANRKAAEFYSEHGTEIMERALEVGAAKGPVRVMSTRYCLRREFGKCLKTDAGKSWPRDLYLQSGSMRLKVEFDCGRCGMNLYKNM